MSKNDIILWWSHYTVSYELYMSICIGLVCCDSWGRKESDMTERLIWSDTKAYIVYCDIYHYMCIYIHTLFIYFTFIHLFSIKIWSIYKLSLYGWNHKAHNLGNLLKKKELTSKRDKNTGLFVSDLTLQQWYSYCWSLCASCLLPY